MDSAPSRSLIVVPKTAANRTLINQIYMKIAKNGLTQTTYFHVMGPFRVLITFIKPPIQSALKCKGSISTTIW
jgi:hypothetical protein